MINKPDIVTVIQSEGFAVKRNRMLCPFHSEKTPSFVINLKRQTAHCFGCSWHGDVISFVQKYHTMTFQEALKYLGISDKPSRPNPKEQKKRELLQNFRQWCNGFYDDICSLYRTLQKTKQQAKTLEGVEALAEFYHREPVWLHVIEVLQSNNDAAKLELFKEVAYER